MGGDAIYFLFFHFSNIYHPIQVGSAYSNSILKEKLERLVIKIRKMISIFRTNNINNKRFTVEETTVSIFQFCFFLGNFLEARLCHGVKKKKKYYEQIKAKSNNQHLVIDVVHQTMFEASCMSYSSLLVHAALMHRVTRSQK